MRRGSVAMGLGGGLVAAALLAFPALDALGELWSARQIRADLTASLAAPPAPVRPLVAPGLAIAGPDRASAARSLAGRIRASGASAGVLVETLSPVLVVKPGSLRCASGCPAPKRR
jgi:hypothetical protein